jgi:hypothetical protein
VPARRRYDGNHCALFEFLGVEEVEKDLHKGPACQEKVAGTRTFQGKRGCTELDDDNEHGEGGKGDGFLAVGQSVAS